MKTTQWTLIILLCLFGLSESPPTGRHIAAAAEINADATQNRFFIPPSAPNKETLTPISYFVVTTESEPTRILGVVTLYDDPATKRPLDYLEFHDIEGNLLLIEWVDKFGITRKAVDEALLDKDASGPSGILIALTDGTPL